MKRRRVIGWLVLLHRVREGLKVWKVAKELRPCRKQSVRDAATVVFETLLNKSCQSIFLFSTQISHSCRMTCRVYVF